MSMWLAFVGPLTSSGGKLKAVISFDYDSYLLLLRNARVQCLRERLYTSLLTETV